MAVAQVLGIVAADRLGPSHEACWIAGSAALWVALALGPRAPRVRAALVVGACLAAGGAGLAARLAEARAAWPLGERTVEVTVGEVAWQGDRLRADLEAVAPVGTGAPLPPRVRLHADRSAELPEALQDWRPGERWRLRLRLREPAGPRNPGRPDPARALERRGVGAVASPVHPGLAVRVERGREWPGPWAWRARTAARLVESGPGGALLATLALGERGGLPRATRDAFARLGLAHLLAVSGMHLSLVAALVFGLARAGLSRSAALAARRDARRPALVLALLAAWAYAGLTGFAVPVRRAALMLSAAALSLWSRRARRPLHPLALASLFVLAREPAALLEPGFQLSFAATAALVLAGGAEPLAEPADGVARRLGRGVVLLVRTSALALLATTPLVAWHFGRVEPAGLLCNVLAIPATAFVLLPAALLGTAAASAPGALAAHALEACEALAGAFLAALVALAGRVPEGLGAGPLAPAVAALAAGLAASALLRPRTPVLIAVLALQMVVLGCAPPAGIEPAPPRVVVLDVGQGDAVLVQGRAGALLVDGGGARPEGSDLGATVVVPALRALGVERLDLLVASHADLDHRGGLPAVLRALPVARVWLPSGGGSDPAFADVLAAARAARAPVEEQGAGDAPLRAGDLWVEPLWPPPGREGSRNDRSLVLRVEVGGWAVLLPGDLEAGAEARLRASGAPLRAHVLKLGHHGSRTSSTVAWLAAVDGVVAIASAPREGRFGMPHPEVVAGARGAGYALWWTGRDGAVLVGLGPVLHVRGWAPGARTAHGSPGAGASRSPVHDLPVFARESR